MKAHLSAIVAVLLLGLAATFPSTVHARQDGNGEGIVVVGAIVIPAFFLNYVAGVVFLSWVIRYSKHTQKPLIVVAPAYAAYLLVVPLLSVLFTGYIVTTFIFT